MAYQPFKPNDQVEQKWNDCFQDTDTAIQNALNDFENGAYECYVLGDVIYALNASPLVDAMSPTFFRQSFFALHQFFERPGTFEFYLTVFRAIWGEDVEVEFNVPGPGKLEINVGGGSISDYNFIAREIVDGFYVFPNVITQDGDQLIFRSTSGLKTQAEVDKLMRELTPQGVFVTTTLVFT